MENRQPLDPGSNPVGNSAFAFWVATTTLPDANQFKGWAAGTAAMNITGANIDKQIVLKLFDIFPAGAKSFDDVLAATRNLGEVGGEWDPHEASAQILNAISNL
jgi:hypothetical protein